MAIYKGDKKVIALYKGDKKIIKRYKGTQVVCEYIPEDTGTTSYADDALVFEFTGTSLTYKLNNTNYTATTSPTIVNLSDLGYNANTSSMFYNLFYNQTNLTKVLHFPKITGTNDLGFGLFWGCKNVEYIDLSNIGNLNNLHLQFRDCTSLKNLILDDVDLSKSNYVKHNIAFYNVPNDIQISMNSCNCESIVTIKQALNDSGIVTYNNNVVTNNNCTFEPYQTIECDVRFDIDEWETYNKELKADYIYATIYNYNEDGVYTLTEGEITEEVSYEYEQFEEYSEDKIKCTIYYKGNNIYEKIYKGKIIEIEVPDGFKELSCDTDKTIPMQKFYINWYEGIDQPGYHYIGFSTSPNEKGDCYDCDFGEIVICPSDNYYQKPNGDKGMISDLPMEGDYYVLDMGETVYFKCGERNALFDHIFYCDDVIDSCFVKGNEFTFEYNENSGLGNWVFLKENTTDYGTTYTATSSPYTITIDDPNTHIIQLNAIDVTKIHSLPDIKYSNLDYLMTYSGSCETFNFSCMDYSEAKETSLFKIPSACTTFIADDMKFKDDYFIGKDVYNMFKDASNLQYLSIKNWPTGQFASCILMFYYNKKLETIDVTGCKFSHITTNTSFFTTNNTALKTIILGETTQEEYDWWYARLKNAGIQNQVTIEYTIN